MIFAILPVKNPRHAKERLSGHLAPSQRETLARMLYAQTLAALCRASGIDRIAVATSDVQIANHASRHGVLVFDEEAQISHSVSADAACARAKALGATTAMLVPIDVPLATPDDFARLAATARPGVIVVPSVDGTGTNALVRTPPNAIESCFGPGSFRKHMDQAREKGIYAVELRMAGLMFDMDTPEDVSQLLATAPSHYISEFLRTACALK